MRLSLQLNQKKFLMLISCLPTETALLMKSYQKIFLKKILNTNNCLTLAIFQKTLSFMTIKDEYKGWKIYEGIPINKFVELKWKMHCMVWYDVKESNAAKGVNIAMEFKEYEDTLLTKKVIRHKMKRIQSKKHKIGTYEVNKR